MHIPKSAGTSVRHALLEKENSRCLLLYRRPHGLPYHDFVLHYSGKIASDTIIYGHYPFGLHSDLKVEGKYITTLRNPVSRALSLYRHECRNTDALYHSESVKLEPEEFFERELSPVFANSATRMIAGTLRQDYYWEIVEDISNAETLKRAKHNIINHFCHVGISERLEESQAAFEKYFGVNIELKRKNVDPEPITTISSELEQIIHDKFALDIELYNYVLGLKGSPKSTQ